MNFDDRQHVWELGILQWVRWRYPLCNHYNKHCCDKMIFLNVAVFNPDSLYRWKRLFSDYYKANIAKLVWTTIFQYAPRQLPQCNSMAITASCTLIIVSQSGSPQSPHLGLARDFRLPFFPLFFFCLTADKPKSEFFYSSDSFAICIK